MIIMPQLPSHCVAKLPVSYLPYFILVLVIVSILAGLSANCHLPIVWCVVGPSWLLIILAPPVTHIHIHTTSSPVFRVIKFRTTAGNWIAKQLLMLIELGQKSKSGVEDILYWKPHWNLSLFFFFIPGYFRQYKAQNQRPLEIPFDF